MTDTAAGASVLHVIVRAGATNSQYNEHCLPVRDTRRITVCSLFPAEVTPPASVTLFEGTGGTRAGMRVLRRALDFGPYDVVHVHAPASGVLTLAVFLLNHRSRRRLVFTIHNSWQNFRPRNRIFLRIILALFPLVVVCGQAAHDSMPRLLRRRYGRKLHIVPNGVDIDRIDAALAAEPDRRREAGGTVVSVNRLIPLKDPATLLEAFVRAHRSYDRLVLVGEGPLRTELEAAVKGSGLQSKVRFTGLVERDEVYRTLDRADVFVSTSGGEGLPVALLEAMACGCPVVVSDIAPHREIAQLVPGIPLVPVGDGAGFARSLGRMLRLSESERVELGRQLRAGVVQHFSVRAMNDAYGEVYMRVISRNGSHRDSPTLHPAGSGDDEVDQPLMTRLRRRLGLAVTLTILGAAAGLVFAQLQTPQYKGETSLLVGGVIGAATDEDAIRASAAIAVTYTDLSRREPVLGPVAAQGFADDWRQLVNHVHAQTGDKNPQLVEISAYGNTGAAATALATAVADQLILVTSGGGSTPQETFLREQLSALQADVVKTGRRLERTQELAEVRPRTDRTAQHESRAAALRSTLVDLQGNYTDMREQLRNSDVGQLTPIDEAWVSRSPLRPTPVALAVAGAGVGFALAVGWVHLLDNGRGRRGPVPGPVRAPAPGPGPARPMGQPWAEPEALRDHKPNRTKGHVT